jgi:hypothetical protein
MIFSDPSLKFIFFLSQAHIHYTDTQETTYYDSMHEKSSLTSIFDADTVKKSSVKSRILTHSSPELVE